MEGSQMNQTEEVILRHIGERDTIFVFPTGLSATTWAERMLEHLPAVAMDRFIAWDRFKGEAIRSQQQDKASIPAMMRKVFASHLIQENARAAAEGTPLFSSIINPAYAQDAQSFTNWLAGLLPSLEGWRRNQEKAGLDPDRQDMDLLYLHRRYAEFLEQHKRFDPAWEQPPFEDRGLHYIIFYPEVLSDFSEYQHILESSGHITLVSCGVPNSPPRCILYSNSRQELRETALFIRNLVATGQCNYSDISVSLPDMETMAPYLRREFQLYAIPAVFRAGKPLSSYGAAAVFAQLHSCLSTDFSFDSIKELLLNRHLPWREEGLGNQLIQFGIDNSCICSYLDDQVLIDPWQEAFKRHPREERLRSFYSSLRKAAMRFSQANSFEKLREAYFQFRDIFWDMDRVEEESDLVVGRCITELAGLMDMEQEFPGLSVPNPFSFFLQVLEEKEYLAQSDERGVSVVPYRLMASAPAGCHIVVGASQKDITHLFQQLGFLSQSKRRRLGLTDSNPSDSFIRLYQLHSRLPVRFSASENTFSGYSIPHNGLASLRRDSIILKEELGDGTPQQDFILQDFILQEQALFQSGRQGGRAAELEAGTQFAPTDIQQEGFHHWKTVVAASAKGSSATDGDGKEHHFPHWREKILQALQTDVPGDGLPQKTRLRISQSHLNDFFFCPRRWYFSRILRLEEPDTQAQLMRDAWMGTIYHDIIQHYLEPLQRCGTSLPYLEADGMGLQSLPPEETARLANAVDTVLSSQHQLSPLTQELLLAQRQTILATTQNLVVSLCKEFPDHQVVALEAELSCQPQQLDSLMERLATKGHNPPNHLPATAEERQEFYSQLKGFVLNGRLDCILNSPDDSLILLDFKLGKTPEPKETRIDGDGRLSNFQMAFYTLLYEGVYPERTIDSAAFMTIKDGKLKKVFGFSDNKTPQRELGIVSKGEEKEPPFNHTVAACFQHLKEFAAAVTTCTFPQMANVRYDTCTDCPWKRICRTIYTIGRDEA